MADESEFRYCGRSEIDDELKTLINSFHEQTTDTSIEELLSLKKRINNFRMKLAYHKGTEFLEGNFGWTEKFEEMNNSIEHKLNKHDV